MPPGYQISDPLMLLAVFLPIAVSLVLLLFPFFARRRISRRLCGLISFTTLAASTALLLLSSYEVLARNQPVYEIYGLKVLTLYGYFTLFADWLSLPIAIAIAFLSSLSALYSISYMKSLKLAPVNLEMTSYSIAYKRAMKRPEFIPQRKPGIVPSIEAYFANLLLFAAFMLGIVLSVNLVQFYIFFELTIIPTFFLIYVWGSGPCKLIAIKYFLYMLVSGASLLAGIIWMYAFANSLDIVSLPTLMVGINWQSAVAIATLLFIGFGMKAAIVPFHTWLPDFHAEAPTPISQLLSGVLIKCGIYGIVRILIPSFPLLMGGMGNESAKLFFITLSLVTMWWGAIMALMQVQIKRILAYSSINQIGYIMLGLSSGTVLGISGALFHVISHGLGKGMIFLCAGSIIHRSGTQDVNKLGGLAEDMPVTATATLLGGLSIAGTPPLAGFVSEWMIFGGVVQAGYLPFAIVGIFSTLLTMGYYLWTVSRIFFQEKKENLKNTRESPLIMIVPISIECFLLVLLGVYPQLVLQLVYPAAKTLSQFLGGRVV